MFKRGDIVKSISTGQVYVVKDSENVGLSTYVKCHMISGKEFTDSGIPSYLPSYTVPLENCVRMREPLGGSEIENYNKLMLHLGDEFFMKDDFWATPSKPQMRWRIGDVLRLKTGEMPIIVYHASKKTGKVRGLYLSSVGSYTKPRQASDYVRYERPITSLMQKNLQSSKSRDYDGRIRGLTINRPSLQTYSNTMEENTMSTNSNTLYETNEETPRFGHQIGVNKDNKIVLEIKTTGDIALFDKKDLTEVTPYTIDLMFITDRTNHTYSYTSTPGAVAIGDIVLIDGKNSIGKVIALDTKRKAATKELKGRIVQTQAIGTEITGSKKLLTE